MGLTARATGGTSVEFEPMPEGLHLAICYGVFDLGTHLDEKWDKEIHKILIIWETPENRIEIERDGEKRDLPRAISKRYTLSLHEKAHLRRDLESWRGKKFTEKELEGFDLKKLLGISCQIQVLHTKVDDRIYANISTVIPAPKGTSIQAENPLKFFSFEDGGELPEGTPEWVEKIITASMEWGNDGKAEEPEEDEWRQNLKDMKAKYPNWYKLACKELSITSPMTEEAASRVMDMMEKNIDEIPF